MDNVLVCNAPCSWGSLEFEGLEGEAIPYGRMLDELRATGYVGTELGDWGYMPTDPAALQVELEKRQLLLTGAFVPVAFKYAEAHAEGQANALKVARLLAETANRPEAVQRPFIVLADNNGSDPVRTKFAGRITPEMGLSDEEWQMFARGVQQVAKAIREETGLRVAFHPHCAGYVETPEEIARLLELTDPTLVNLVFDTGHYLYGTGGEDGRSVPQALERFGERIQYLHFKDCQPEVARQARREGWDYFEALKHGVFCELGQGAVDFGGVVNWMRTRGYQGWVTVEQDILPGMGSPYESAERNRRYLTGLGL
jgi:inosose dehydratase